MSGNFWGWASHTGCSRREMSCSNCCARRVPAVASHPPQIAQPLQPLAHGGDIGICRTHKPAQLPHGTRGLADGQERAHLGVGKASLFADWTDEGVHIVIELAQQRPNLAVKFGKCHATPPCDGLLSLL